MTVPWDSEPSGKQLLLGIALTHSPPALRRPSAPPLCFWVLVSTTVSKPCMALLQTVVHLQHSFPLPSCL